MRAGEVWCDKKDGSKVRIVDIYWRPSSHGITDNVVVYEDLDRTSGSQMFRKNFLYQYEKCEA